MEHLPNQPYLDANVAWRVRSKNIEFRRAYHEDAVGSIEESGLATRVKLLLSSGKGPEVYLWEGLGLPSRSRDTACTAPRIVGAYLSD